MADRWPRVCRTRYSATCRSEGSRLSRLPRPLVWRYTTKLCRSREADKPQHGLLFRAVSRAPPMLSTILAEQQLVNCRILVGPRGRSAGGPDNKSRTIFWNSESHEREAIGFGARPLNAKPYMIGRYVGFSWTTVGRGENSFTGYAFYRLLC